MRLVAGLAPTPVRRRAMARRCNTQVVAAQPRTPYSLVAAHVPGRLIVDLHACHSDRSAPSALSSALTYSSELWRAPHDSPAMNDRTRVRGIGMRLGGSMVITLSFLSAPDRHPAPLVLSRSTHSPASSSSARSASSRRAPCRAPRYPPRSVATACDRDRRYRATRQGRCGRRTSAGRAGRARADRPRRGEVRRSGAGGGSWRAPVRGIARFADDPQVDAPGRANPVRDIEHREPESESDLHGFTGPALRSTCLLYTSPSPRDS